MLDLTKKYQTRDKRKVCGLHSFPTPNEESKDEQLVGYVYQTDEDVWERYGWEADGRHLGSQECGADLIEVPESVVHPIGPEHKLKVGDKVQSCKGGDIGVVYEPGSATKKEYPYSVAVKWQSGYQGHSTYHASFGQSVFYPGDVYYGSVTRISHAPTPEPANQTTGEWVRVHEAPTSEPDLADLPHGCVYTEAMDDYLKEHKAKLAAQKADLLEEADRVNPRLMQATDEQIEAERERRRVQALPQKLLDEAIDSLASEGIGFTRAERRVDLENLCKLARAAERELIKQEGGSHE